jgi:uncharacterized OB-fold protein
MIESKTGEIVFTQIGKIPQTGETYGLITVRTSDDEKVKLKINDSTEYEKLRVGTQVTVEFENVEDSRFPVAREVKINSGSE